MNIGKVSPEILEKIVFEPIKRYGVRRPEVKIRPGIGEDCTALALGNNITLLSTDPITAATEDMGYLCVHINANDVASGGGEPVGIMVTVLLPDGAEPDVLQKIMDGVYRAAAEINIEVLGGHTEVTDAVTRPVVSATVIGRTKRFVSTGGAKPGQALVMTKWAGLEGTAILAAEHPKRVKSLGDGVYSRAAELGKHLSVISEAQIALDCGASAMHDVTEGGILGACYEMAIASGTGVLVELNKIGLLDETRKICELFQIDPYKLISSGSLLIACDDGNLLCEKLNDRGIAAFVIGKITQKGIFCKDGNELLPINEPESDEIYKIRE